MTTDQQRAFLNAILSFVGSTSLTDDEASPINLTGTFYDADTFAALLNVAVSRGAGSTTWDRLRYFFAAKGVPVGEVNATPGTNIFIGSVLE